MRLFKRVTITVLPLVVWNTQFTNGEHFKFYRRWCAQYYRYVPTQCTMYHEAIIHIITILIQLRFSPNVLIDYSYTTKKRIPTLVQQYNSTRSLVCMRKTHVHHTRGIPTREFNLTASAPRPIPSAL